MEINDDRVVILGSDVAEVQKARDMLDIREDRIDITERQWDSLSRDFSRLRKILTNVSPNSCPI